MKKEAPETMHETPDFIKSVTLQDIADYCGVSKAAVRWVLRGDTQHVGEATRERISAAAKSLGYDPSRHQAARKLAMRKFGQETLGHIIALFIPPTEKANYFDIILHGALVELQRERFGMLIYAVTHPDKPGNMPLLPMSFDHGDVDGVIMYAPVGDSMPKLNQLRSEPQFGQRPVVALFHPLPGCINVLAADWDGGYAVADHLLGLGHRHVGHFYVASGGYPYAQRLAGMEQACRDHGLIPAATLCYLDADCFYLTPDVFFDGLLAHPKITAIIARNDIMAREIHQQLNAVGQRVPQDYSLIGYDDTDAIINEAGQNILTSVRIPLEEVGRDAARLILKHVRNRSLPEETVLLPTSLVMRQSVAAPRAI